jgi:hypothetical protein
MSLKKPSKTGDVATETGIYRVYHDQHRLPHEVTVLRGDQFPRCAKCNDAVSFELFYAAPLLSSSFKDVLPVIDDDTFCAKASI